MMRMGGDAPGAVSGNINCIKGLARQIEKLKAI
jgi:hypothetical protein